LSGRFPVSAVGLYQLANCEAAVSKRVGVIGFGAYHLGVLSITVRRWDDSTQSHGAAGLFLSCFFVWAYIRPRVERGDLWFLVSSLDLLRDVVFLIWHASIEGSDILGQAIALLSLHYFCLPTLDVLSWSYPKANIPYRWDGISKEWTALCMWAAGYEATAVSGHADGHWTDAGTQRRLSARPWCVLGICRRGSSSIWTIQVLRYHSAWCLLWNSNCVLDVLGGCTIR